MTRRILGLVGALLLSVALGVAAAVTTAPVASAAGGWSRGPGYSVHGSMVGFWLKGGTPYICLDTQLPGPKSLGTASAEGNAETNYLMAKYLRKGASDTTAAALAVIVKDRYDDRSAAWKAVRRAFFAAGHGAVTSRIAELLAEAATHAGPYSIEPVVALDAPTVGAETVTGRVSGVGVLSAARQWMTQEPTGDPIRLTVTLTNATFADGSTARTVAASSDGVTLDIVAPVGAEVVATVAPLGVRMASSSFDKYAAIPAGTQKMARFHLDEVSPGSSAGKTQTPAEERSIVLESQVRTAYVKVGDRISDHVHVLGQWVSDTGAAAEPVAVSSTAYGPFASQPETSAVAPEDAAVFDSFAWEGQVEAGDSGVLEAWQVFTTKPTTQEGFYVFVETAELTNYPGTSKITSPFGRPWETAYAANPRVSTQVLATTEDGRTVISDRVNVSGLQGISGASYDAAGEIATGDRTPTPLEVRLTGKLLGPVPPVAGSCEAVDWAAAPTALTIDGLDTSAYGQNATNGGDITWFEVGRLVGPEVGACYSYTYTFAADSITWEYGGSAAGTPAKVTQRQVFSIDLAAGIPSETTAQYALSSQVGPGNPAALTDTVFVDGLLAGATIEVTSTLYGPLRIVKGGDQDTPYAEGDETELLIEPPVESWTFAVANPALAPVVATARQQVTGDAGGHQEVTFTSPALAQDGWYCWVEASDGIPDVLAPYSGSFGRPSECVRLVTPTAATPSAPPPTRHNTITKHRIDTGVVDDPTGDGWVFAGAAALLLGAVGLLIQAGRRRRGEG